MADLAFSVTAKDCELETFRCGGKGGQNQNKRDTGVRWRHRPSGATGESREHRTQLENKRAAWRRMAEHPKMRFWIQQQVSAYRSIPRSDLRVEVLRDGRWIEQN
jgi:protein subunit release factor B